MRVFQLAYLSFASEAFDKDVDRGMGEILDVAVSNNKDLNITGMLLFKGGIFIQLLEGDKEDVLNLYGRIASDLRHEGLKVLVKQDNSERLFEHWSMSYQKIDNTSLILINEIINWDELVKATREYRVIDNKKILDVFKKFRFKLKNVS